MLDTAVFVYARGGDHPYREPCRRLVEQLRDGALVAEASVELAQEFGHILRRRGLDPVAVRNQTLAVAALCRLHDFGQPELRLALSLQVTVPGLGMRDAVHAATAVRQGIGLLVSPDRAFGDVPGLERIDPAAAVDRLTGVLPPRTSS